MAYDPALGQVIEGAGVPSDALFSTAPSDGQRYLDQTTGISYTRTRGVWQSDDARLSSGPGPSGAATQVAAGAATVVGSTGTVTLGTSDDTAGSIVVSTSGTAPSTVGVVATVTFGTPFAAAPRSILISPASAAAGTNAGQVFVSGITATGFTLNNVVALTNAASYTYNYLVVS